jgi:alpha-beta hydrolase superfamily lysophospholipase
MHRFFQDPLFEDFTTTLALGLASHGGGELGEVEATCARIADGDDASWYAAWRATADRLVAAGDESARGGHPASAREAYLRAALYYSVAYHPLFGAPVDRRLLDAFGRQRAAFDRAAALLEPAGERLEISLDGAHLPGYLFRCDTSGRRRPLLIATNGYDGTLYEMYLAQAVPALRRGYDCLVFDGPGQGAVLYEQNVPMRPDWEAVVRAVVDAAVARDDLDHDRMVLTGWSLGGHLALRAASGEHRLAACIADPGLFGMFAVMAGRLRAAGVPQAILDHLTSADSPPDPSVLAPMADAIARDRAQRWAIIQRGFWVHGVASLAEYLRAAASFTLDGRAEAIRCPTLLTAAENDPLAASASLVLDALRCPKALIQFRASEGAGDHCEMRNRSLLDQRVFDWLDQTLGWTA